MSGQGVGVALGVEVGVALGMRVGVALGLGVGVSTLSIVIWGFDIDVPTIAFVLTIWVAGITSVFADAVGFVLVVLRIEVHPASVIIRVR